MSNIKQVEVASVAFTITLASLNDTGLTQGRESTAVSNLSNLYLDYHISGKITTGTSPSTGGLIEVWAYPALNDSLLYPDTITGTDANATITNRDVVASAFGLVASMVIDGTSDRTYYFKPVSVASLFGGVLPPAVGVWVTHSTGVALNATAGNHAIYLTGKYASVA
jgi:hypothetical protein